MALLWVFFSQEVCSFVRECVHCDQKCYSRIYSRFLLSPNFITKQMILVTFLPALNFLSCEVKGLDKIRRYFPGDFSLHEYNSPLGDSMYLVNCEPHTQHTGTVNLEAFSPSLWGDHGISRWRSSPAWQFGSLCHFTAPWGGNHPTPVLRVQNERALEVSSVLPSSLLRVHVAWWVKACRLHFDVLLKTPYGLLHLLMIIFLYCPLNMNRDINTIFTELEHQSAL